MGILLGCYFAYTITNQLECRNPFLEGLLLQKLSCEIQLLTLFGNHPQTLFTIVKIYIWSTVFGAEKCKQKWTFGSWLHSHTWVFADVYDLKDRINRKINRFRYPNHLNFSLNNLFLFVWSHLWQHFPRYRRNWFIEIINLPEKWFFLSCELSNWILHNTPCHSLHLLQMLLYSWQSRSSTMCFLLLLRLHLGNPNELMGKHSWLMRILQQEVIYNSPSSQC